MAGNTPEVSLRISAQDNASEILRKIQAQLANTAGSAGRFSEKAGEAFAGQSKLARGFEDLARQAIGFGRAETQVARGIAESFGITGMTLMAVAAAVGALAAAYTYLHKAEKQADDNYKAFMESMRKPSPLSIIGAELDVAKDRLVALQEQVKQFPWLWAQLGDKIDATARSVRDLQKQYNDTLADNRTAALAKGIEERLGREKKAHDALAKSIEAEAHARAAALQARVNELGILAGITGVGPTPNLGASTGGSTAYGYPGDPAVPMGHAGEFHPEDVLPYLDLSEIANAGFEKLTGTMRTALELLPDIATGFADIFQQLGAGGFDAAAKSFGKFIAQLAGMEGRLLILKGIGKIADAIWLPGANAASLASGLKMIAAGAALEVFSGMIGGGGAVGSGVGGVSGTTMPNGQVPQSLPPRGKVTLVVQGGPSLDMSNPASRDALADALQELGTTRDLEIYVGGMAYAL